MSSTTANRPLKRFALFEYGFRPFFLLAGLYAVVAIALWLYLYANGTSPLAPLPPQLWHGHEMLFGFVAATIAGFMLTAVPSWTGRRGFAGRPLVILALAWLAGRIAFALPEHLPAELFVFLELAFLPALAFAIAPSLLSTPGRNRPLLPVLAAFWAVDAAFLWAVLHDDVLTALRLLRIGLDVVLLLITVIGGRIVPAFTSNALRNRGVDAKVVVWPFMERLVIGSMIALIIADLVAPQHLATAIVAGIACLLHAFRMSGWRTLSTLPEPIVWVLHAAYAWLPIGLGLKALYLVGGFAFAAHWLHALAIGAAATMILAVMTRASLGHTGRPLKVATPITLAYAALVAGAVVRTFGPSLLPVDYVTTVRLAGGLWLAAFLLFLFVYAPILCRPRADCKPG